MGVAEHLSQFAGRKVVDYSPQLKSVGKSPQQVAYRVAAYSYDGDGESFADVFDVFLNDPKLGLIEALIIGPWEYERMCDGLDELGAEEVVESLVAARERLAGLKHVFLGDVIFTECEISWLQLANVVPIFDAYPTLEEFRVRGVVNLSFSGLQHPNLKTLAIESGGIPKAVLHEIWAANLPALEHLELWLGTENYGGITQTDALDPLLAGRLFPKLTSLALCNSDIQDAVTMAVAQAPLLERLQRLELSLGNLTNDGARSLLASPSIHRLHELVIEHHYLSPELVAALESLDLQVDVDPEAMDGDEYEINGQNTIDRYNAHSE